MPVTLYGQMSSAVMFSPLRCCAVCPSCGRYTVSVVGYGTKLVSTSCQVVCRFASRLSFLATAINVGNMLRIAAKSVIALIAATQDEIAPRAIVDKWVELAGTKAKAKAQAMWEATMTYWPTFLACTNFVLHAAGWLESGLTSSY